MLRVLGLSGGALLRAGVGAVRLGVGAGVVAAEAVRKSVVRAAGHFALNTRSNGRLGVPLRAREDRRRPGLSQTA